MTPIRHRKMSKLPFFFKLSAWIKTTKIFQSLETIVAARSWCVSTVLKTYSCTVELSCDVLQPIRFQYWSVYNLLNINLLPVIKNKITSNYHIKKTTKTHTQKCNIATLVIVLSNFPLLLLPLQSKAFYS